MNKIIKEKIKQAFTLFIIIVAFLCVISVMLKYNNEGETKMPFNLTEMLVVSSADGEAKAENPTNNKWNLDVNQYNDISAKELLRLTFSFSLFSAVSLNNIVVLYNSFLNLDISSSPFSSIFSL